MTHIIAAVVVALSAGDVLLSTDTLADMPDAVVVDARDSSAFEEKHIAGALSLPVGAFSEDRDGVSNLLKPLPELEEILRKTGVGPSNSIVVYSGMEDGSDLHLATRLFWILEYLGYPDVYLLDGGLAKWEAEGRPTASGAVAPEPLGSLSLSPDPTKLATKEEVAAASKGGGQLLDLRSHSQYLGTDKSGAVVRAGHIPNASNLPASDALTPERTFKNKAELKAAAEKQGLQEGKPVATYCNTGRAASVGYFMLRHAGYDDVSLYDGSMSEWSRDETMEVKEGEKP